jgi:hypothetical protein
VDVQLQLAAGGVAGPHRRGPAVALQVVQGLLGRAALPVDAVQDPQVADAALRCTKRVKLSVSRVKPSGARARSASAASRSQLNR